MNRQNSPFIADKSTTKIGHQAIRGGVASFLGQGTKFVVQMAATMVLARILTPDDFGLMAMIIAVTAFLNPFKDFGLSMATLQRSEISHAQVSNLFWLNMAVATILTIALMCLSPLLSLFYKQPLLTMTTCVFALKFILEGFGIQHQALLRRTMRFGLLSIVEVGSLALASVAAVVAAQQNLGHWALIIQQLCIPLFFACGVWATCNWRPGLPTRNSGVRPMVAFGGTLTLSNILYAFLSNFDNMLIGWRWGASALGLYSKAYALLVLPINQISAPLNSVAIASLSRLQKEPDRYRNFYCRLVTLLAFITTPLLVVMAVLSRDIIYLVLGEQWLEASAIFTILAIASLGQPMAGTIGLIFISLGQADRQLKFEMFSTPLTICAFLIGLRWGPIGVAAAYTIAVHAIRIPALLYAYRYAPVKITDFFKAIFRPVTVSGLMFIVMMMVRQGLVAHQPIIRLLLCCLAGGAALAAGVLLWPETRRETIDMIRHIRELWHKPKTG